MMKIKKRIFAFVLILATLFTLTTIPVSASSYVSTRLVSQVAQVALSKVGTYWDNAMCEAFAETMYRNAKITLAYKGCAKEACDSWWQSSTSSNIPIGAMVFASSSSSTHNGHNAGHVGIYVGDGFVVHGGVGTTVRKDTLADFLKGRNYWGWGIGGGYTLDYNTNNRRTTMNLVVYSAATGNTTIGSLNKNEIVLYTGKKQNGRAEVMYFVTGTTNTKTGYVNENGLARNLTN